MDNDIFEEGEYEEETFSGDVYYLNEFRWVFF